MTIRSPRSARRALTLAVFLVVLAASLALAGAAAAAPPEPTMSLDELRTALESGPLDGYMLTTLSGTTPEQIPLQVESIIDYAYGSLILIQASGTEIDEIGGIAAGMSGSPVYVDDGGVTKLVGAVSYGDIFTLNNVALATPIEYMADVELKYPVAPLSPTAVPSCTYTLSEPVRTEDGVVRKITVARSAKTAARADTDSDELVMSPLGLIEIGGLRPQSKAFKKLAAKLEDTGMLVKAASGDGAWTGDPTPDLESGSPCAMLFSNGAVWVGATGTVTYVDGDTAMLFGHPFEWLGEIDAALTGGYVEGVWPSSYEPYVLTQPRDVKGTVVQDRYWGVEADLSSTPDFYPVTTIVNDADQGTTTQDDSSVSQWFTAGSGYYYYMTGEVAAEAVMDALDQYEYPGSAETTTTIEVSDETGSYTIQHENLWDSSYDVSYRVQGDIESALAAVSANSDGVLDVHVDSVKLETTVTSARRSARVTDVSLPNGLRAGDNTVRIEYYRYGSSELQSMDATLTIPKGTPVNGYLSVMPATWVSDYWCCCFCCCCCGDLDDSPPQTLADIVDDLNEAPSNDDLLIMFEPRNSDDDEDETDVVQTTVSTGYRFNTYFSQATARVRMSAHPSTVDYEGKTRLSGYVRSSEDIGVSIYRRNAGSTTEVLVDKVTAVADGGYAFFKATVPNLKRNATIVARTDATDDMLPGSASRNVKVRADVRLTEADGKLTVHVRPGEADGKATIQRKVNGSWVTLGNVTITNGAGTYRLGKGDYTLRAKFGGDSVCVAGTSPATRIVVR